MDIPVLIKELPDRRFRARCGEPFGLSADGATSAEALNNLQCLLNSTLSNDTALVALTLPAANDHSILQSAGVWREDDDAVQEWEAIMAENRRQQDEDEGIR